MVCFSQLGVSDLQVLALHVRYVHPELLPEMYGVHSFWIMDAYALRRIGDWVLQSLPRIRKFGTRIKAS